MGTDWAAALWPVIGCQSVFGCLMFEYLMEKKIALTWVLEPGS